MSIHLVVADPVQKTGRILAGLLSEHGVKLSPYEDADALVSYGVRLGESHVPALNAYAGMADKKRQMERVAAKGIRTPVIYEEGKPFQFPLLARKRSHKSGKDIMPVFQSEEIPWRSAAGAEYFVSYIPRKAEYRVWVFRGRHLGTYQKHMVRPHQYTKIGWNFQNGFAFQLVQSDDIPRGAVEPAVESLRALGLDFAAVDVLQGLDGNFYFLEANTAPGVEGPGRQVIQKLSRKIAEWESDGYPRVY